MKGIMDHYCLVQGTWHGHHAAQLQQSTAVKGILTACCVLWAKQNLCHITRIKREKYLHKNVVSHAPFSFQAENSSKHLTI